MNIIEIKNNMYSAKINLSHGGNCISLRHAFYNAQLLREPDYDNLDSPFLYGMPILFPINRIENGRFTFEGREYVFPINEPNTGCHLHGTLHSEPFTLISQTESSLICAYRSYGKYLSFPHDFEIKMHYSLTEDGLSHMTEITNLSNTNMPCLLGFHTTFPLPFISETKPEQIFLQAEIGKEIDRDKDKYLSTGKLLMADVITDSLTNGTFQPLKQKISRHYYSNSHGRLVLFDECRHVSIVYQNGENFDYRLIFNGNADSFICLEPQNCFVNAPNTILQTDERGFDIIKPNESQIYHSKLSLQNGDLRF